MQVFTPTGTPRWISTRRFFERILSDLHNCKELSQLKQVLAIVFKSNLHRDNVVGTKLISAFALCRQMGSAVHIFDHIEQPDVLAYNVMIKAHVGNSQPLQALRIFSKMQNYGVRPNIFTYPFLLKANLELEFVAAVHALIKKCGFSGDVFAPNSLIVAYSQCGAVGVSAARKLFSFIEQRDNVTWNCMISGCVKNGQLSEARVLFDEMPHKDIVSWNTMLDGYVKLGELSVASELFEDMPGRDSVSWSTMVLGYSKAGNMEKARYLFDKMPVKNMVAWTILISAYVEKGFAKEAKGLYDEMAVSEVKPDEGAIISILGACAESGMLGLGNRVHDFVKKRMYNCSTRVLNALINMYAKCGRLDDSLSVFHGMKERDSITWSTMIHGLAIHGYGEQALQLFSRMLQEGFAPNKVTFIGLMCACSHAGLVDDGIRFFDAMQIYYGINPEIAHYGCMIDLLGRGGRLKEAFRLVLNLPVKPNEVIWGALLAACRKHDVVAIGEEELQHLVQQGLTDDGNLSILSDIYAAAGDWSSMANARVYLKNARREKKISGTSSIELENEYHHFTVMDACHPKSDQIYKIIDALSKHMRKAGSFPRLLGDGFYGMPCLWVFCQNDD